MPERRTQLKRLAQGQIAPERLEERRVRDASEMKLHHLRGPVQQCVCRAVRRIDAVDRRAARPIGMPYIEHGVRGGE